MTNVSMHKRGSRTDVVTRLTDYAKNRSVRIVLEVYEDSLGLLISDPKLGLDEHIVTLELKDLNLDLRQYMHEDEQINECPDVQTLVRL